MKSQNIDMGIVGTIELGMLGTTALSMLEFLDEPGKPLDIFAYRAAVDTMRSAAIAIGLYVDERSETQPAADAAGK
ncbi:MAG TPA: hypothetical protein VJ801_11720 [Polyangia bacterium]|nr:hypothetical protein [Polyangia bacterium]